MPPASISTLKPASPSSAAACASCFSCDSVVMLVGLLVVNVILADVEYVHVAVYVDVAAAVVAVVVTFGLTRALKGCWGWRTRVW